MKIELDFSNVPGDVGLALSQHPRTRDLADSLSRCMYLGYDERQLLHQEIVGTVASVVDGYLSGPIKLKA